MTDAPQCGRAGPVVAALLMLSPPACTIVGPDYVPPQTDLPEAYDAPVPALFGEAPLDGPWWTSFGDPALETLVQRGLSSNLDVRTAASRVREARAVARRVEGETGPSLDSSGEAGVDWLVDDNEREGFLLGLLPGLWEIDLFGRLYRTRQAAWARAEQQEALRREARRLVAAEIALAYVGLRAAERRLALTLRSLALQRRTLELVEQRVDSGLAPGLDLVRARAEIASLRADVGPLQAEVDRFRNALAVLLAVPPGALDPLLVTDDPTIPRVSAGPAIGVPVELVRRRPDIQAAELQVVAATADVGVAVADLYPRLSLPGSISVDAAGLGAGSVATTVLASLSALLEFPLYDGGAREAAVTEADERVVQATLAYRQTLLSALEQVEAALLGYQGARARRQALEEAVENNRLAYEQSRELYRQGLVTFLDVLDSQRQWTESLQQLANAERDLSSELVNLYAALGGSVSSDDGADDAAVSAPGRT